MLKKIINKTLAVNYGSSNKQKKDSKKGKGSPKNKNCQRVSQWKWRSLRSRWMGGAQKTLRVNESILYDTVLLEEC